MSTDQNLPSDFGELDRMIFERLKTLNYQPKVIFDIGASNGWWSKTIYPVFPEAEYHLFEPLIDFSDDYRTVMAQNLQSFPSFYLHKYAMGEVSQDITISVLDNANIFSSTALDMSESSLTYTSVPVKMITIDEAVESLGIPVPQVIKIDTQGYELSILKGAQKNLPNVDILLIETWLYRGYGKSTPLLTELIEWLLQFEFRLWDIGDEYRNEQGVLECLDCAFINVKTGIPQSWYY